MCREYKCLPSQLFAEDAEFLRMINIDRYGAAEEREEVNDDGE